MGVMRQEVLNAIDAQRSIRIVADLINPLTLWLRRLISWTHSYLSGQESMRRDYLLLTCTAIHTSWLMSTTTDMTMIPLIPNICYSKKGRWSFFQTIDRWQTHCQIAELRRCNGWNHYLSSQTIFFAVIDYPWGCHYQPYIHINRYCHSLPWYTLTFPSRSSQW